MNKECEHDWRYICTQSGTLDIYICRECGKEKVVDIKDERQMPLWPDVDA